MAKGDYFEKDFDECSQGDCPHCGSDDLEYGDAYLDGDLYIYNFKCNNCGTEGKERYVLDFSGMDYWEGGTDD